MSSSFSSLAGAGAAGEEAGAGTAAADVGSAANLLAIFQEFLDYHCFLEHDMRSGSNSQQILETIDQRVRVYRSQGWLTNSKGDPISDIKYPENSKNIKRLGRRECMFRNNKIEIRSPTQAIYVIRPGQLHHNKKEREYATICLSP